MRIQAFAMGVAVAWATIGAARATDVQFTITGDDGTATFELPLSPTPDGPVPPLLDYSFRIVSVPAVVGGSPVTLPSLDFYSAGLGGGGFFAGGFFNFTGPQFYSGSEYSPTFIRGSYEVFDAFTRNTDTVTVTISDPPDPPALAVPELSTWAMLLLGFVGLSYAGYRRARTRTIN